MEESASDEVSTNNNNNALQRTDESVLSFDSLGDRIGCGGDTKKENVEVSNNQSSVVADASLPTFISSIHRRFRRR